MLCSDKKSRVLTMTWKSIFFSSGAASAASKLAAKSEALHSVLHLYTDFLFLFLAAAAMSTVSDT